MLSFIKYGTTATKDRTVDRRPSFDCHGRNISLLSCWCWWKLPCLCNVDYFQSARYSRNSSNHANLASLTLFCDFKNFYDLTLYSSVLLTFKQSKNWYIKRSFAVALVSVGPVMNNTVATASLSSNSFIKLGQLSLRSWWSKVLNIYGQTLIFALVWAQSPNFLWYSWVIWD